MKCKYETTGWYDEIKRCLGTKEVDPCPGYEKCQHFKPYRMTNADRIRAMTDEELALFFGRLGFCNGIIPRSHCHAHKVCGQGCVVDWLKQPAEV